MLFKITRESDFYHDNPSVKSIPDFHNIKGDVLKFVSFVYDYESPYRSIPEEKRKERILKDILSLDTAKKRNDFLRKNILEIDQAKTALEGLLSNDPELKTWASINATIDEITNFLLRPTDDPRDLETKVKLNEKLSVLIENKRAVEKAIGRGRMIEFEEEGVKSVLERFRTEYV